MSGALLQDTALWFYPGFGSSSLQPEPPHSCEVRTLVAGVTSVGSPAEAGS